MTGVAADEKHWRHRVVFVNDVKDLSAVALGHDDVQNGQVDGIVLVKKQSDRRLAVVGQNNAESLVLKMNLQGFADQFVVVSQEDRLGATAFLSLWGQGGGGYLAFLLLLIGGGRDRSIRQQVWPASKGG